MNCRQADSLVQESLDRALTAAERADLDLHAAVCEPCRIAWEEYRALSGLAAAWAQPETRPAVSDDAFAAQVVAKIEGRRTRPASVFGWRGWAVGAACAAATAGIAAVVHLYGPALGVPSEFHPADLLPRPQEAPSVLAWLSETLRGLPAAATHLAPDLSVLPAAPAWTAAAVAGALAANAALYLWAASARGRDMLR
jgi:hypothetical protein